MKKMVLGGLLAASLTLPSLAFAKAPLFFNTGDELFEIEGAPTFDDGFSLGYACKRFGLFGADIWTWDCDMKAVNLTEFSAGDLPAEMKEELSQQYSLSDRKRDPWNHYGAFIILTLILGYAVFKLRRV